MSTNIGRWLKRLTTEDSEIEATKLSSDVTATVGVKHVGSCGQGERVTILGRLRFVDLRPTDALATLVAELWDGTDAVQLVWLGRRSIPGVEPGRTLKARGRIAYRDGHKVMYNPDYELMPVHA
jgi:hypothetical protein